HVEAFVEGAVVDRAVAEERDSYLVGLEKLEAVPSAGGLKDARSDDATRAHHADLGGEQVHTAAAAAGAADLAAVKLGHQVARRQPFRQSMAVTTMRAEHDVISPQMGAHSHGNGFLAHVRMAGAMHQ